MRTQMTLGVEIGGSKLQLAAVDADKRVVHLHRGSVEAPARGENIRKWLEGNTPPFLEELSKRGGSVERSGIGFGGPVDVDTGRTFLSHQVAGWDDFPLREWFARVSGTETVVVNDSNAAGWGEYVCGNGAGTRNFCYMNIGSGIGGALVIDGRLHNGQGRGAGDIGHTWVPDWTAQPGVANKLENLCSGWSIEGRMVASPPPPDTALADAFRRKGCPSCAALGEAARQGDPYALAEIERVAGAIGVALANVVDLVAPERIALGGGVALLGNVLLDPIRRHVEERVMAPHRGTVRICRCALDEMAVPLGAALLAGGTAAG